MKRIAILVLTTLMLLALLTASSFAAEKVTILYPGEETDRMTEMLRGPLASKLLADLDMELEMIYIPWGDYWNHKTIKLQALDPIDLYWDGTGNIGQIYNLQECRPLDELIETYAQDMLKVLPLEHIARGGTVDGQIFAIPSAYKPFSCMRQLVCLRQDILEAVGMDNVATVDDLYEFAVKAKEMFPEIKGVGDPMYYPISRYFAEEPLLLCIARDELVAFNEATQQAVSYFESQVFQDLCRFNATLAAAGLFSDEETLNYEARDARLDSGNYLWMEGSLGKDGERINSLRGNVEDAKLATYLLSPQKPKYVVAAGGEALFIPYSAANPEGAMKFLNWMYSSPENYRLCVYGVEGEDYTIVDGRIQAVGETLPELFYEWMFDNTSYKLFPADVTQEYVDAYLGWDDGAVTSSLFGFTFNNENVLEIEVRLQEAMRDFRPLMTGFVDFDEVYPSFVQNLKNAGIDEYVAEVQRQIDVFLGKAE
jgi:ABC-type glycerol-3-phosphate transport system substrate-binding protein